MENFKRLDARLNVDLEAECLYRYVHGTEDRFNPHCHNDFLEIFLTISGTVWHFINGKVIKLPEGSLVFIRADDVHGFKYDEPDSKNCEYINLTFTRQTAEELFSYLSDSFPSKRLLSDPMPPTVLLSKTEKEGLLHEISELNTLNWQNKNALKIKMRALLSSIFVRYFSDEPKAKNEDMPLWLSLLIKDMEKPENFTLGTEKMLSLCTKSREHLARSIKKHLNCTISEFVNGLRLNYASNLLLYTNSPIIEICFACGFQTTSQFYKLFKEKYGVTPNKFRELYQFSN